MSIVDLPLDERNIIITRSKEGILEIKKIFTSKGANVFDLPAISIGDPDDLNPLDEALNQINDFHWIIFNTSSRGLKSSGSPILIAGKSYILAPLLVNIFFISNIPSFDRVIIIFL